MRTIKNLAKLNTLTFWSERGLIRYYDEKDGTYGCMSVRTFLHRLNADIEFVKHRPNSSSSELLPQDREKHIKFWEDGIRLCHISRDFGEPWTEEGRAKANSRLPKSFYGTGVTTAII